MKKNLLFLTAILFSVSSFAYDFEVDGIYYNITSASQRTVEVTYRTKSSLSRYNDDADSYNTYSGDVIVPETVQYEGKYYKVTSIGIYAFSGCRTTNSVSLPRSVVSIGKLAFGQSYYSSYPSIKKIVLQEGLINIDESAFYCCISLSQVNIPSTCTTIGNNAFYNCSSLSSIIIPSSCTFIGYNAFSGCSGLRELYFLCPKPDNYSIPDLSSCEIYVPNKNIYAAWTNTDQLVEFVSADENVFTYSGNKPNVSYTNNLPFLTASFDKPILESEAGSYETSFKVKYTGEMEFEVEIPYLYTINKAPAQLTVNNASKVYGDENPTLGYELSGLIGNDELDKITISTTADLSSDAGTYPIKASVESKNYDVEITEGTLIIQKAPLVVQVNDAKKKYGDANPDFTLSYTGMKCDDPYPKMTSNFIISTDATKASNTGKYDIEVSGGESNNYSFSQYKKGTLTIEPVPLTITPKAANRLYGDKNPEFSFSYSGFVNGDDESSLTVAPFATCQARPESEVGDYEITVDGAANQNYSITYGSAFLTVEKAPLLIQAEDVTREYGTANPEYTFKYTGFKNEEDESVLLKKPTAQSANLHKISRFYAR